MGHELGFLDVDLENLPSYRNALEKSKIPKVSLFLQSTGFIVNEEKFFLGLLHKIHMGED